MFTTNTVQAGNVPTLQYQEHPTQKSQGKNIENVQQKGGQQTQQQVFLNRLKSLSNTFFIMPCCVEISLTTTITTIQSFCYIYIKFYNI